MLMCYGEQHVWMGSCNVISPAQRCLCGLKVWGDYMAESTRAQRENERDRMLKILISANRHWSTAIRKRNRRR